MLTNTHLIWILLNSNTFKKYLPGFDGYSGDFAGLKKLLNDAVTQLQ